MGKIRVQLRHIVGSAVGLVGPRSRDSLAVRTTETCGLEHLKKAESRELSQPRGGLQPVLGDQLSVERLHLASHKSPASIDWFDCGACVPDVQRQVE